MKEAGEGEREKQKRGMKRDLFILGAAIVLTLILFRFFPDNRGAVLGTSWDFLVEMMSVLPAVMVLLGLFAVWVPKETVGRYLGKTSGVKGIVLAVVLGSLPTGPLYIAFPMAAALLKKGAKISNIIVFLSAWACIKIPQEMVELQFMGAPFTISRFVLTIFFVILMGLFIEWVMKWSDRKGDAANAS